MKLIYKQEGETPLAALERMRDNEDIDADVPLSYAGRLDPMAEGVLLVLVGDENQKREKYLGLDKQYAFQILFGVRTDTFDALGMVQEVDSCGQIEKEQISKICDDFVGRQEMTYPPYSAATIDGTPLWKLARDGKLEGVELPKRQITIDSLICEGVEEISAQDLLSDVETCIGNVDGDFRQEAIIDSWKKYLKRASIADFYIANCTLRCSAGTYVRRIAEEIGKRVGCGAIALSIKRTQIEEWTLEDIG